MINFDIQDNMIKKEKIKENYSKTREKSNDFFTNDSRLSFYVSKNTKRRIFSQSKINKYTFNFYYIFSSLVNILLIEFILIFLPKEVLSYTSPDNYIIIKLVEEGIQQIFSDSYNINAFYPFRIYVNNKVQILREKRNIFINSKDDKIKIEWVNCNPNLTYMFANVQSIKEITINNLFNINETNISYMFYNCQNLESFSYTGTENNQMEDATKMFYNCFSLKSVSFGGNYIANNINMAYMFHNCYNLSSFYFSPQMNVSDMRGMFYNCYSITSINISNFNSCSGEVNVSYLFYNCHNLETLKTNSDIYISDMRFMFYNCFKLTTLIPSTLTLKLENLIINSAINMSYLFYNCQKLSSITLSTRFPPSDMRNMFYNCSSIKSITIPFSFDEQKITNMTRMFYNCVVLENINSVSNESKTFSYFPNDIHEMFYNCKQLSNLGFIAHIKTNNTVDMSLLFYNCLKLTSLELDFSNELTKNMKGMFQNSGLKILTLSNFYTNNVEIMWDMFKGCKELTSLDLTSFNTAKVTDMESMFEGCENLSTLSLENFDTSKVQYMNKMFRNCIKLSSLNFGNIETDSVGTMHQMFYNCQNLQYLNLSSMKEKGQSIAEMFTGVAESNGNQIFKFCIGENENIPNIFELLKKVTRSQRDCSESCYGLIRVNISEKKLCCKYVKYEDNCYEKCPSKTQVKSKPNICEDFNCSGVYEYYNYEQSECTNDTRGYYKNDSIAKTIDKCHDDCIECNGGWSNETTNCTICKSDKPYIYLGNCYPNCNPGFYDEHNTICKCFDPKCELCNETSLKYDLCQTCNKDYYPKENDTTNKPEYPDFQNCYHNPEGYYLSGNNIYKPCYNSCRYCTKEGDIDNHYCTSCNDANIFGIKMDDPENNIYNCYPNCTYYYYFDDNNNYKCTKEPNCPKNYSKIVDGDRECVNNCTNIKNKNENKKYEFRGVCYEFCPPDKSYNESEYDYFCKITCPFEAPFEMVQEQICVTNCTIMERYYGLCRTNYRGNRSKDEVQDKVLVNIQDDIIDTFDYHFINYNLSIVLEEEGNTYEIVTTTKTTEDSRTSYIKLGSCEATLKNYYNIEKDAPLYLLKLDAKREGMQNPKVEYLVYYPLNKIKLEQLDLTLCEGDELSLLFTANLTGDEDLFNKNSGFYNDICYTYTTEDGTDIPIQARQQNFKNNNQSLCEEGCEFVKYHYETEKAECACNVKINVPLVSEIKIDKDALYKFADLKNLINFDVMKCFNLFFDRKKIVRNIGFYIFFPTLIMYIVCIIIFYVKEYKLVKVQINEIVSAKKNLYYILDKCKAGIINKYTKFDSPVYLNFLHEKGKKLPSKLRNRSIKNKQTMINKTKEEVGSKSISIKSKIKIKVKVRVPKKKANEQNQQDNNTNVIELDKKEEEQKEKNNIKSEIIILKKDAKLEDNINNEIKAEKLEDNINNEIKIEKQEERKEEKLEDKSEEKIEEKKEEKKSETNQKNAPPKSSKRSIINDISSQKREISYKKNLVETSGFQEPKVQNYDDYDLENIANFGGGKIDNIDTVQIKKVLKYNDNELNAMNYNEALKHDHRSFLEFYFSLLKTKHLLITLFETRDYNSRIIKIFLLFFNFSSCYAINGLFFDDDTMNKIYEEKGTYNLVEQLPSIMYSAIIGYFFDFLLTYFALSEDDVVELKQEKEIKIIGKRKNEILKGLHIKFIIFFIISLLLLIIFWYYIGCFCAVYNNTQYHLLKDTLISFATSFGTPFAIYIVPPIIRIPALKKKSKTHQIMFTLSKIIQFF